MTQKSTNRPLVIVASVLLAVSLAAGGEFANEILANSDIINLTKASMADDIIIAKIRATPNVFDLSTNGLVTLKTGGVSDEVIRAMHSASERSAAGAGGDNSRFRVELENIASGLADTRNAGFAWMVANRDLAIPALRRSLSDSRPELRAAAVSALSRIGDRDSLSAIRSLLTDPSPLVRQSAAQALSDMDDQSSILAAEQAVSRQLNPLDGYIRLVGYARLTQAASALGRVLEGNPDSRNRIAAAWALGEIGRAGTAGRPALEKALETDAESAVRREAAGAVAKFHDSRAAQMLQDACARDPQVRKTTLAAMAEYPEAVEFLVGVMNLGPDQIAGDEIETARASLSRLAGRDLGMDGTLWNEWFQENRNLFPSPHVPAAPPTAVQQTLDTLSALPGLPVSSQTLAPARPPEVDVVGWGIVADSSGIPMAPQVEAAPASAGSLPAPSTGAGGFSPFGGDDFSAATSGPAVFPAPSAGRAQTAAPSDIPGMMDGDADDDTAQGSMFRSWSSDPDRTQVLSSGGRTPTSRDGFTDITSIFPSGSGASSSGPSSPSPAASAFDGYDDDSPSMFATEPTPTPTRSALPESPVIGSPASGGGSPSPAPAGDLGGIALPLPPMEGGGFEAAPTAPTYFEATPQIPAERVPIVQEAPANTGMSLRPPSASSGSLRPPSSPYDDGASAGSYDAGQGGEATWQDGPFDGMIDAATDVASEWVDVVPQSFESSGATDGGAFVDAAAQSDPNVFMPFQEFESAITQSAQSAFDAAAGQVQETAAQFEDASAQFMGDAAGFYESAAQSFDASVQSFDGIDVMPPLPGGSTAGVASEAPSETPLDAGSLMPPPPGAAATFDSSANAGVPAGSESSVIFVEPEPGQLVVGDPILIPEQTYAPAEESIPAMVEQAADALLPPAPQSREAFAPLPEPAAASDEPTERQTLVITPPASPSPSPTPESFRDPSVPLPPVKPEGTVRPEKGRDMPTMLGEGMFGK